MLSFVPAAHLLHRLAKMRRREVKEMAERCWEVAPAQTTIAPPAIFLPGQLERVTGFQFASPNYAVEMFGGYEVQHAATVVYEVRDVLFIDGVLYKGRASSFLKPSHSKIPSFRVKEEVLEGALYSTPGGNTYFGQWLIDDCVTYPLAAEHGIPVSVDQRKSEHRLAYKALLGMDPLMISSSIVRKLVLFEDFGQNSHKSARFRAISDRLTAAAPQSAHPGVFVIRGTTGNRRVLLNEMEIAERLRERRGFRVINPMEMKVKDIIAACTGARVVVGVEGSQLVHAILTLKPADSILAIMPPTRFCSALKDIADRDGISFGFTVGLPRGDDFTADPDELERTLDLLCAASPPPGVDAYSRVLKVPRDA